MTKKKIEVTAYFEDYLGSDADKLCHAIFEQYGGEFINCD
jgi:hypothetical protein